MSSVDLRALLWGHDRTYKSLPTLSPLTRDALAILYRRKESYSLSTEPSPLTPLFDKPALPEGRSTQTIENYNRTSWPTAQFVHNTQGTFVMNHTTTVSNITWLTRLHLSSYCKKLHDSKQIHRPLTDFEQLFTLSETPQHTPSLIYKMILDQTPGT